MRQLIVTMTSALAFVLVLQSAGEARPRYLPTGKRVSAVLHRNGARWSRAAARLRHSLARKIGSLGKRGWRARRNSLNLYDRACDNGPQYTGESVTIHMYTPKGMESIPHYRRNGESRGEFEQRVRQEADADLRRAAGPNGRAQIRGYDYGGQHPRF